MRHRATLRDHRHQLARPNPSERLRLVNTPMTARALWLQRIVAQGALEPRTGILKRDVVDPEGVRHSAKRDRWIYRQQTGAR